MNKTVDFQTIKIRCSAIGDIMTEARSKSETLGETAKKRFIEQYIIHRFDRKPAEIMSKYLEKGLGVEEDGISLYAELQEKMFVKNEEHFSNDYITGTPDIITGTRVDDIKSSWDIFTFYASKTEAINKKYWWQLQGYMALTGCKSARLVYVLVNTPTAIIEAEKRKEYYKYGSPSLEHGPLLNAYLQIEENGNYDDIPTAERLHIFEVERDDDAIERIYDRVSDGRIWLNHTFNLTK